MKKLLTIVIIIVALGGAVFLGYTALTSKGASPEGSDKTTVNSSVLPFGVNLDFDKLQTFNNNNRFFPFPKVTPSEIGTANSSLVP